MHMRRETDTPHIALRKTGREGETPTMADDNYTKLEYVNNVSM